MISVHYRNPINYNRELVDAARAGLERIQDSYRQAKERADSAVGTKPDSKILKIIEENTGTFETHMDDDFNTANAISAWHELTSELNKYLRYNTTNQEVLVRFIEVFEQYAGVLGIVLEEESILLDEEIEKLIEERNDARKNKDFSRADEIRDSLKEQGIVLEDTKEGVRFKRG